LDNLITQGKAKPMIMVNTLGYGGNEKYTEALLKEVIPQVEKTYHASKDRINVQLQVLSMGGGTAIYASLSHVDNLARGLLKGNQRLTLLILMRRPFQI